MSTLYTSLLRPLLFRLDPERAHDWTIQACRIGGSIPGVASFTRACLGTSHPALESDVAGLHFPNPIGLAAGWDKSGRALRMLDPLGFGFAEIGSVSARPSVGNPRPRLFRLPQDRAIVVNYGLPNDGAEVVSSRLAQHRSGSGCPLGVNIVKTNDGPNTPPCDEEQVLADYVRSVSLLHSHADYLMLNLSCPNAIGGRQVFSRPGSITALLSQLAPLELACPLFLKVAPHDDPGEHERLLTECEAFPFVRGFCFNLPMGKPDSLTFASPQNNLSNMPGAVAGKPVESLINRNIAELYTRMDPSRYVIIGAGGVFTAEDAYQKIRLGASLVQIYTALIYQGPGIVKKICQGLVPLLNRDGFEHISQAVGTAHRERSLPLAADHSKSCP